MRSHRVSHAYARMIVIIDLFAAVATAIASFALAVIRYGAVNTWQSLQSFDIMAYRKIADLRPVYRESYDTHGLSLDHSHRPRC